MLEFCQKSKQRPWSKAENRRRLPSIGPHFLVNVKESKEVKDKKEAESSETFLKGTVEVFPLHMSRLIECV